VCINSEWVSLYFKADKFQKCHGQRMNDYFCKLVESKHGTH